jgi:hypothetical protein
LTGECLRTKRERLDKIKANNFFPKSFASKKGQRNGITAWGKEDQENGIFLR